MDNEFEAALRQTVMKGFSMLQEMREVTDPIVKEDLRDQIKLTANLVNAGNTAASRTTSEIMQERAIAQRIAEFKHKVEVTEPQAHEEKMAQLGLQARWLDLVAQGKAVANQFTVPKGIGTTSKIPQLTTTSNRGEDVTADVSINL